jgi:alpha-tubulin suppressor-like RCC1 family protein
MKSNKAPTTTQTIAPTAALVAALVSLAMPASAQTTLRVWGSVNTDTEEHLMPAAEISAYGYLTVVRRVDGRIFVRGQGYAASRPPPPAPQGLHYVAIDAGSVCIALRSDGALCQWGAYPSLPYTYPLPTIPPGQHVVAVSAGTEFNLALTDQGMIVGWGENGAAYGHPCDAPPLTVGLRYTSIAAGQHHALATVSDGSLRGWGRNLSGQCTPPQLPAGVSWSKVSAYGNYSVGLGSDGQVRVWGQTVPSLLSVPGLPPNAVYTNIAAGGLFVLALRSDGALVAWGENQSGQLNVPLLPPGLSWVSASAGSDHSVALRSDGQVISWGDHFSMQHEMPPLPANRAHRSLSFGAFHGFTLLDDASLYSFGIPAWGTLSPPPLAPPLYFTQIASGFSFSTGVVSDGSLRAWGSNSSNQNIPPGLPASGARYVRVSAGLAHGVAVLDDGTAVGWGYNGFGQISIPPPPAGLAYVDADANGRRTVLLLSNGTLREVGSYLPAAVPTPPPGQKFEQVRISEIHSAAMLDDGTVITWDQQSALTGHPYWPTPRPPHGIVYVELAAGDEHIVARRSDGEVVAWGRDYALQLRVPPLPPGRSYLRIDAGYESTAAIVGHESRYVGFALGCRGTLPTSRIIPRDTPQIGRDLPLLITNLPHDIAFLSFAWQKLTPGVDLTGLGMPGCTLHTGLDAVLALVGNNRRARWTLPIPDAPVLLGARFHQQAAVLDPAANALGLVLSDAYEAVIGG